MLLSGSHRGLSESLSIAALPWSCLLSIPLEAQNEGEDLEKGEKEAEKEEEEEEEGGFLTPLQPLHSALQHSKELPPSGNFSKAPVMVFEAAIKNKCFLSSPFLSGWMLWGVGWLFVWAVCMKGRKKEGNIKRPRGLTTRKQGSVFFSFFCTFRPLS